MNFADSIQTCVINKYMDFNGRASRSEYWWFFLFCIILAIVSILVGRILYYVVAIALFIPSLAVAIRRLHDTDKSGWWFLITFIPVIGPLVLLYFYIIEGTKGPNRFGNPPA